jgi:hypothetical protein
MALIGLGIASLIVSVPERDNCGRGVPKPRNYVFGTGIAYIIIGVVFVAIWFLIWKVPKLKTLFALISWVFTAFLFAWMIVGAVTLWRDGYDCINLNLKIWQMTMADVIVTIVFVCSAWLWLPNKNTDDK